MTTPIFLQRAAPPGSTVGSLPVVLAKRLAKPARVMSNSPRTNRLAALDEKRLGRTDAKRPAKPSIVAKSRVGVE